MGIIEEVTDAVILISDLDKKEKHCQLWVHI